MIDNCSLSWIIKKNCNWTEKIIFIMRLVSFSNNCYFNWICDAHELHSCYYLFYYNKWTIYLIKIPTIYVNAWNDDFSLLLQIYFNVTNLWLRIREFHCAVVRNDDRFFIKVVIKIFIQYNYIDIYFYLISE